MRRWGLWVAVITVTATILATVPAQAAKHVKPKSVTITLTLQQSGKPVSAKPGDTIIVRLEGNRTTGFNWTAAPLTGKVLQQAAKPAYEEQNSGLVGAGGVCVFTYKAAAVGSTKLTFQYARSWEKQPPAKTATFTVTVKK